MTMPVFARYAAGKGWFERELERLRKLGEPEPLAIIVLENNYILTRGRDGLAYWVARERLDGAHSVSHEDWTWLRQFHHEARQELVNVPSMREVWTPDEFQHAASHGWSLDLRP